MPRFFITNMNIELLDACKRRVPNTAVLINMISKRSRQLIGGQRPMVKTESQQPDLEDISLKEIAEGKIMAEIDLASE